MCTHRGYAPSPQPILSNCWQIPLQIEIASVHAALDAGHVAGLPHAILAVGLPEIRIQTASVSLTQDHDSNDVGWMHSATPHTASGSHSEWWR